MSPADFNWKKVDRSLTEPMKRALVLLYLDGDLYPTRTKDGTVYLSPGEQKVKVETVAGLRSRSLVDIGRTRAHLNQLGRRLMNDGRLYG